MNKNSKRQINMKCYTQWVKRRKTILVCIAVFGLILGSAFSIITGKAKAKTVEQVHEAAVAETRAALGTTEVTKVDNVFTTYQELSVQLNKLRQQSKKSIYINLDPNDSKGTELVYLINNNKKINAIGTAINALVVDDDLCNQINSKLSKKISPEYLKELVNVTLDVSNTNDVKVETGTEEDTAKTLVINIYAQNDKQLKVITNAVKAKINKLTQNLSKVYGSFSCKLGAETSQTITSNTINTSRVSESTSLSTITSAMSSLTNTLTVNQKAYFDALATAKQDKIVRTKQGNSITLIALYAIAFAVIFIIITLFVVMIKYLKAPQLLNEKELEQMFGATLIGQINNEKDADHVMHELAYLLNNSAEKIGIVSSNGEKDIIDLIDYFSKNVDITKLKMQPESEEDYQKLVGIKKIVIIEKINSSSIDSIEKMLEYYNHKGIEACGSIVID